MVVHVLGSASTKAHTVVCTAPCRHHANLALDLRNSAGSIDHPRRGWSGRPSTAYPLPNRVQDLKLAAPWRSGPLTRSQEYLCGRRSRISDDFSSSSLRTMTRSAVLDSYRGFKSHRQHHAPTNRPRCAPCSAVHDRALQTASAADASSPREARHQLCRLDVSVRDRDGAGATHFARRIALDVRQALGNHPRSADVSRRSIRPLVPSDGSHVLLVASGKSPHSFAMAIS